MVLFTGKVTEGYFVEEVCNLQGIPMDYIKTSSDIQIHKKVLIEHLDATFIVYDISKYTNTATEIAEEISNLSKAMKAKPIIYAQGYDPSSNVIVALKNVGMMAFIYEISPAKKKEELKKFFSHYYEHANEIATDESLIEELVKEPEASELSPSGNKIKTIAVAGSMGRMGTTTQALQIAKAYLLQGYNPCYIALDGSDFVHNIASFYNDAEVDEDLGKVAYEYLDLFYNPDNIKRIMDLDYDCFVYDYGVFSDGDFNRLSFMEKDAKIVVCGGKPSEITSANKITQSAFYSDVYYVFSFIAQEEQNNILDFMEELGEKTFFPGYIPNPFTYSSESDFYKEILFIEDKSDPKAKKRKKGKRVKSKSSKKRGFPLKLSFKTG